MSGEQQIEIGQGAVVTAVLPTARIGDYIKLAKPGIVGLTLVAALTGIYFANDGMLPDWHLIGWTFLTLGLATAGACILNNAFDRDIDAVMKRTESRAVASGLVSTEKAYAIGLVFVVGSLSLMARTVNVATAVYTLIAVVGYVVIYTMLAKRRTSWANQLGGIAGALPPLIGYVAVTGQVDVYAFLLFIIMVIWQQPHALSLALKYREDYARANVPVVPVAKGVHSTKWRILLYSLALIPVVSLPYLFNMAGNIYLALSLATSLLFIGMAINFLRSEKQYDLRLFFYSIFHLIVIFGSMIFDKLPLHTI